MSRPGRGIRHTGRESREKRETRVSISSAGHLPPQRAPLQPSIATGFIGQAMPPPRTEAASAVHLRQPPARAQAPKALVEGAEQEQRFPRFLATAAPAPALRIPADPAALGIEVAAGSDPPRRPASPPAPGKAAAPDGRNPGRQFGTSSRKPVRHGRCLGVFTPDAPWASPLTPDSFSASAAVNHDAFYRRNLQRPEI